MEYSEKPHKRLLVWQQAMHLVVVLYEVTSRFPASELYCLVSQLRRAAISVPSNIAEGLARSTMKDKVHFLIIAQSSLSEVDTQIEISCMVGYISEDEKESLLMSVLQVQALLTGLIRSIRNN